MPHCLQGTDIRGILKAVAQVGRDERQADEAFAEAFRLVTETNPLPSICGRVCPHPCEVHCIRNDKDAPVAINDIERFVGDWGLTHDFKLTKLTDEVQPEKIAVIGSGPAGLACAYQLARRGYRVTLFEAFPKPGGMLRYGIPSYRLPRNILDTEINRILDLGIELRLNTVVGRDISLNQIRSDHDAVFIGIGAQKGAALGCPGENAQGVYGGVEFLRMVNSGQPVDLGQKVIVVGGGNTAIDAARVVRRLNPASEVTILYRRSRAEMPAIPDEVAAAEEEGIEIVLLAAPVEIQSDHGRISRLICQRMELTDPDASGRRKPVPIPNSVFTLEADALIAAVSQQSDWDGMESVHDIKSDEFAKRLSLTDQQNVFVGGDVRELGLVAESLLQGRQAAEAIHAKFRGITLPEPPPARTIEANCLHLETVRAAERHEKERLAAGDRLERPWEEESKTLSSIAAVEEATRCISCGESFIKRPKTHPLHIFRRISQIGVGAFLFNSYFAVFSTKTLYNGPFRNACVPGLNCHSCPTATMGCPIGILQYYAATHRFPWFLLGFLGIIGLLSGRFTCGWLCPWGLVQDLTHRFKKVRIKIPRLLHYLKYVILIVVAIIIPYITFEHWFSKLCPCGALIAAIPWALWNPIDPVLGVPYIARDMIASMFWIKMWILWAFLVLFLFIKRPFCRTICPLGAIYALFNRISLVSVKNLPGCVDCGQCDAVCPVDLNVKREVNSEACIKCLECTQCQHNKFSINQFWKKLLKKRRRPLSEIVPELPPMPEAPVAIESRIR